MTPKSEIYKALKSVHDTTEHQEVKKVMERALRLLEKEYDDDGLLRSVCRLLDEMAYTKRVERAVLYAGPVLALTAILLLFAMLQGLL